MESLITQLQSTIDAVLICLLMQQVWLPSHQIQQTEYDMAVEDKLSACEDKERQRRQHNRITSCQHLGERAALL